MSVSGASADIEADLGDTITLHGFSYIGDRVYLFMTGPGLPANGVTLTNTALRADQGQFTIVGLDDNQEWIYVWKTSRIDSEINPGTYMVYVTNEPVDLSNLGGSNSYKTITVFLKQSDEPKVSVGAAHVYTLNPEKDETTLHPSQSVNITTSTTPIPVTTAIPVVLETSAPPTRAGAGPSGALISILFGICVISFLKGRR